MEHTPGPLRIEGPSKGDSPYDDGGDYAIFDAENYIIGEAFKIIGVGIEADAKANAQLWAVASDLLTACEATANIEHYTYVAVGGKTRCRFCDHPQRPTSQYDEHNKECAIALARGAIAAARGK